MVAIPGIAVLMAEFTTLLGTGVAVLVEAGDAVEELVAVGFTPGVVGVAAEGVGLGVTAEAHPTSSSNNMQNKNSQLNFHLINSFKCPSILTSDSLYPNYKFLPFFNLC